MTIVQDSLADQIVGDFHRACGELARALNDQHSKDTPAHRATVVEWRANIDDILDMFLAVKCDPRHSGGTPEEQDR